MKGKIASVAAKRKKERRALPKGRGQKREQRFSSVRALDAALRAHCIATGNEWAIGHAEGLDRVFDLMDRNEERERKARAILRKLVRDAAPVLRGAEGAFQDTNITTLRRACEIAKVGAWRRANARERVVYSVAYWRPDVADRQIAMVTLLSRVSLNNRRAACRDDLTLAQALRREERDNYRFAVKARRDSESAGSE